METDKIIQDLNRRFAAPLPEFYQRRIIFWYDEDKEFQDKLDEVVLENAKVIALTGNNAFSVKKLLSVDDLTTNYLVYSPCVYNRPDDNWLLDVELYSEEFRADLISIWMDEMGLISNPAMRKQVKNYRAYFNAKDRRLKVSTQNKVPETLAQLHMAVMAAICGLKDARPNMILRSVFRAGTGFEEQYCLSGFCKISCRRCILGDGSPGLRICRGRTRPWTAGNSFAVDRRYPYHAAGVSCRTG